MLFVRWYALNHTQTKDHVLLCFVLIYKNDPVHAMKAYRRYGGIALLILNLGTRWWQVVIFMSCPLYPWKRTTVHIE
jgi:hypothetical protein